MSMAQPRICDTLVAHEKSNALEELEHVHPSNSSPLPPESDPPDGGFWAWATVFGCFLIQFCGFGYVSSFGVYQDFYTRIYLANQPPSAISWIGALTSFLADSVTLISGPLYDRGWFYQLMIVGSALQSISLFALSLAKPGQFYLIFIVQGILSGIGMGLTYGPCMAVISQHFSKRRTLVMSLVASGSPMGAVVHPIMLNHLLNGTVGFERGVRASAGFVSALLLISCLSMRTRALSMPKPTTSYNAAVRKCSRDVFFILITAGSTIFQIGYYFPIFYLQLDSIKHGIDVHFSFYSLVIMNAACVVGRCTAGIIAAYTGALNFTMVSTLACSALIICMIALSDVAGVVVLGLGYGYFSGVCMCCATACVTPVTDFPRCCVDGTVGDCVYARLVRARVSVFYVYSLVVLILICRARFGICFAFTAFGGLLGGPISGALLSSQYRWWIASLFSGLICFVGSSMFVVMRLMIYRRRKTEETLATHNALK